MCNNIGLDAYLDRRHNEEQEQNRIDNLNDLIAHDFEGLEFPNEINVYRYLFKKRELWYTIIDEKIVEIDNIQTINDSFLVEAIETLWESVISCYLGHKSFEIEEIYDTLINNNNQIGTFVKVQFTNLIYVKKNDE